MGDMKIPKLRRKKVEAPAAVEAVKADSDVAKPKRVSRSRRSDEIEQPVATSAEASFTTDAAPETSFTVIDEDERRRLIAEAAYYRAAQRGFVGGSPENDWLEAEAEVRARLGRTGVRT